MRARLKRLYSEDVDDVAHHVPPVADDFAVPLVLEVGPLGIRGKERFELLVVTPRWLLQHHGRAAAILGAGKLIVFEWDFARVKAFLGAQVERCTGRTWPDVARKVARIAEWEGDEENIVGLP